MQQKCNEFYSSDKAKVHHDSGCVICWGIHLSPAHADDAVDAAVCIVEEGHGDRMFASRQPVAFGGRVNLKDVSSGAEDGLFPSKQKAREANESLWSCGRLHVTSKKTTLQLWHKGTNVETEGVIVYDCNCSVWSLV